MWRPINSVAKVDMRNRRIKEEPQATKVSWQFFMKTRERFFTRAEQAVVISQDMDKVLNIEH